MSIVTDGIGTRNIFQALMSLLLLRSICIKDWKYHTHYFNHICTTRSGLLLRIRCLAAEIIDLIHIYFLVQLMGIILIDLVLLNLHRL